MSSHPMMMGACCPKSDNSITQLRLADGRTVGIMGLTAAFEQLVSMGRTPDQVMDAELLEVVRAQKNYIPPKATIEADYAVALRRAYAAFHTPHIKCQGQN